MCLGVIRLSGWLADRTAADRFAAHRIPVAADIHDTCDYSRLQRLADERHDLIEEMYP